MKLARRLATASAALSLILLLAVAVTWVRSVFVFEWVGGSRYERLDGPPGPAELVTGWTLGTRHSLKLTWGTTWYVDAPAEPREAGWAFDHRSHPVGRSADPIRGGDLTGEWRRQSSDRDDGSRADTRLLVVPYWAACLLLATPPLLWLRGRRRVGRGAAAGVTEADDRR